jgi:hypothetical protein
MRTIKFRAYQEKLKRIWTWEELKNLPLSEDLNWSQFTGLKDKNGKEIYEGDVVKARLVGGDAGGWYSVWFNALNACWMLSKDGTTEFSASFENLEVIGNIYENPELLGEGGGNRTDGR